MALYEVRGLRKAFGENVVLESVDLDVYEGEFLTLLGVSGSGKSLLVKMMLGLFPPDAGQLRFEGEELTSFEEREWIPVRRKIGMLFQESALFDSMTVFDNVAYGLREQRLLPEDEIPARVTESLNAVSLPGTEERWPKELSGGMQKRVALARAIAMRPGLLFYDEPTEGLDPINVTRVNRLLLSLRDRFGITTVVVTHNMRSAFATSDRLAFLHDGRIARTGTPAEFDALIDDPQLRHFVAASRLDLPTGESLPPPPLH
ncbi:MAG: ATP-binding cassette domain-containing protein [Myxococcales bacterium]|nr:ATP-binding cassette domain-containing protein [Myxococcales bacterium]